MVPARGPPRDTSGTTEKQVYITTRVAAIVRSFGRAWHIVYQDSTAAILPAWRQRLRAFPQKERGQFIPAGYPARGLQYPS